MLTAIVGEIGNNSFDHNLGKWSDVPGIYYQIIPDLKMVILADRGCGIFSTLKNVRPNIENDLEALTIAFTEIVSGRSPEQRGNDLKFVKKVAEQFKIKINFFSGLAQCEIENGITNFSETNTKIPGTIAIIEI